MSIPIIIFLGIPGSGKGTQAVRLAERHGLVHICTGDLLRALDTKDNLTPEESAAHEAVKSGQLVSGDFIYKLSFSAIRESLVAGKGCVLDGAIRTVEQAEMYDKFLLECGLEKIVAINIALTDEESVVRLMLRKRADDTEEIIRTRLSTQGNSALQPLVDYYAGKGILENVQGVATMDEVEKDIEVIYQKYFA